MDMLDAVKKLCSVSGPSGFETDVVTAALEIMKPFVDEQWVDSFGNVVGVRRCGRAGAKKTMLIAHLDEIGLMVSGHQEGFLKVRSIGGVDPRTLPGREFTVLTDPPIFGVIDTVPPHSISDEELCKAIPIEQLSVSVGMSAEEIEQKIPIGTPITFRRNFVKIGANRLCGTALDDRACFVVCLQALEYLKDTALDCDLYLLGTRSEEIPAMGVQAGVYTVDPDYCIVTDVIFAVQPGDNDGKVMTELGKGPEISVGSNMTRHVTRHIKELAKKHNIPFQLRAVPGYTACDAWRGQVAGSGCEMSLLSLPMRYMHSPVECVDMRDMDNLAKLIAASVSEPCEEVFSC